MAVYDITLKDPTENVAPPERLLRLRSVGDMAFLSVETYDEGNPTTTSTVVAEIAVSLPALRESIQLLSNDRDRESLRERDAKGQPGADILGNRLVVAPL